MGGVKLLKKTSFCYCIYHLYDLILCSVNEKLSSFRVIFKRNDHFQVFLATFGCFWPHKN